jgi:choline dehydrogenase-like flavoprotein
VVACRGRELYDKTILKRHPDPNSDGYVRALVIKNCLTVYHPTGTTRMGPVQDPTTVVDTHLRVRCTARRRDDCAATHRASS